MTQPADMYVRSIVHENFAEAGVFQMSISKIVGKTVLGGGIGYIAGCLVGIWTPDFVTLLFPLAGSIYGVVWAGRTERDRDTALPPAPTQPPLSQPQARTDPAPAARPSGPHSLQEQYEQAARKRAEEQQRHSAQEAAARSVNAVRAQSSAPGSPQATSAAQIGGVDVLPIFQPVLEYLGVLEEMIISEGQKHNLDNEIVEKSCALFLRLQRVIPILSELNNDDINHTIKRLVMNDLNSVINPFLRLSGEAKTKNRRILLDGLKDVNSRVTQIVKTIEHKDLMELQSRAELLHHRYS